MHGCVGVCVGGVVREVCVCEHEYIHAHVFSANIRFSVRASRNNDFHNLFACTISGSLETQPPT